MDTINNTINKSTNKIKKKYKKKVNDITDFNVKDKLKDISEFSVKDTIKDMSDFNVKDKINDITGLNLNDDEEADDTDEADDNDTTDSPVEPIQDYGTLFNKYIYNGSISLFIIIIVYLITINVLSITYKHNKGNTSSFNQDINELINISSFPFDNKTIHDIFYKGYDKILNWHSSDTGKFIHKLISCVFPPLLIVVYLIVFIFLQFWTFLNGNLMLFKSIFNVKNFFVEKFMVVFSLMVLFGLSVFFIYMIMQKGFNLSILKSVLITIAYFILFSSLPFTGFLSFYIFILIFFNSYNKINKLFFNVSKMTWLFLVYILITFCAVSLAQNLPKDAKIASGIIIGILIFILTLIIIANIMTWGKWFNSKTSPLPSKIIKFFANLPESELL